MKRIFLCTWVLLWVCNLASAQATRATWGNQGNGTYINPILNADYSDSIMILIDETCPGITISVAYWGLSYCTN